uniref:Leishmanolysin-like peptidase n=1 Tax=Schistosoma haematobium TaxID=6185 RepID=A0A095CBK6_SCHHA
MAGETGVKSVLSALTLAFFTDSGGKSIEPYCDETGSLTCYHKKAFGICAMGKYKNLLPPEEQYFKGNPNVGGTSTLTDRCPTVQPMETFFKEPFMTYCDHRLNIPFAQRGNMFGQAFGNRSICIPHMGAWRAEMNGKLTQDPRVKATCHDYKCSRTVQIVVDGETFPCISGIAKIKTWRIDGNAICPDMNDVCRVSIVYVVNNYTSDILSHFLASRLSLSLPLSLHIYIQIIHYVH